MKLASEIGANPNKYMGTKTNINFLGTGDKAMKGTSFGGPLRDDFLEIGVSQNDLIKVVEQDMGYVTSGKLNDSQLKVMTDNLTMARDALNPVPPTNLFDIATGTGNLNKKGLESLRGTNIDNKLTNITDKISEGITSTKAARKAEGDFNKMGAFDSGDSFAAEGARRAVLRQALLKDENALKSLPDGVVDSLKNSKDLMGKANSGNDPLILFRAIYGDAVDFNKIDDIIASEPFSDANTIADKVLAFLKQGDNFADGGRIGYRSGGIFKGLKGIQFGRIQKDLTKKYKDEGMEFMEALQKGNDEGLEIINEKKLNFLNGRMNEVNIYSDDYVKLIDEHIRIVEPDFYKDIKRWEGTRPDLADKTRASFFPDWAEARYGENYMGVLQKKQAKAINESIDPNFKEPLSSADQMVSDIDDMNKANIDDLFGIRKKNADGGRIGYKSGKFVKDGIAALLKLGNKKFGKDTIKVADDIEPSEFSKFNERNRKLTKDELEDFENEIGDGLEAYDFDGTVASANRILKEQKDYMNSMFTDYKAGRLDPVAGDKSPARMKFLKQKAEEAEMSGDSRLFTADDADELMMLESGSGSSYGGIRNAEVPVEMMTEDLLLAKYPGISERLAKQIGNDKDLQRKAEAIAAIEQGLALQGAGKSVDETIEILKREPKIKMKSGGLAQILEM